MFQRIRDWWLERRIAWIADELRHAQDKHTRRYYSLLLRLAIAKRSPQQVARMEAQRGLVRA